MTYLDELAEDLARRLPRHLLPEDQDTGLLLRLYVLLALVKGGKVTAVDVHDAWSVWMTERNPNHPSLRPFHLLDAETQQSDEPFAEAIRELATRLADRGT